VGDAGVAGDHLDERTQRARVAAQELGLDPAVLVAEVDLQVMDGLAVAQEPERAGLDHARVDRPDLHLVDLLARQTRASGSRRRWSAQSAPA
jgi:hypothetical protein